MVERVAEVVLVSDRHTVADGRVAVVQLVWCGGEVLVDVTHGGQPGRRCGGALVCVVGSRFESCTERKGTEVVSSVVGGRRWVVVGLLAVLLFEEESHKTDVKEARS